MPDDSSPPWTATHYPSLRDPEWVIRIKWKLAWGKYEPDEVTVKTLRGPFTATRFRAIPIGQIIEVARASQRELAAQAALFPPETWPSARRRAWSKAHRESATQFGPHRRRPSTAEELSEVAAIWHETRAFNKTAPKNSQRNAAKTVAATFGIGESAAKKRIAKAKAAGLLDEGNVT